ncbi:MAG: adenosine deaminase [Spirochaetaceae bacterium 4572_7]|nr:MAG: adenosine deaminase [Spirochaetaceae bacterium 4572_7]
MNVKKDVIEALKKVPKTEIHLHIEAVTTASTVWKLIKKHKLNIDGVTTLKDLEKKFNVNSLEGFIDLFINVVQKSFKEEDDFNLIMNDLYDYLKNNNIVYAEVFLAPTTFLKNGLSFDKIIDILQNRADEIEEKSGIDIKFLIDVSRGFGLDNAMKNLNLTLRHKTERVIGIGLGGAEKMGKAQEFVTVFDKAKEAGLRVVAHAGEDDDYTSVDSAVNILGAERIGHGISAMESEEAMDNLKKKQIPLEICPTSNLFTRAYVTDIHKHPVKLFYDKGLFVTINSDDPTLFGSTLLEEYGLLVVNNIFSRREIGQLVLNNLKATFMEQSKKDSLEIKIRETLNSIGYL